MARVEEVQVSRDGFPQFVLGVPAQALVLAPPLMVPVPLVYLPKPPQRRVHVVAQLQSLIHRVGNEAAQVSEPPLRQRVQGGLLDARPGPDPDRSLDVVVPHRVQV